MARGEASGGLHQGYGFSMTSLSGGAFEYKARVEGEAQPEVNYSGV